MGPNDTEDPSLATYENNRGKFLKILMLGTQSRMTESEPLRGEPAVTRFDISPSDDRVLVKLRTNNASN